MSRKRLSNVRTPVIPVDYAGFHTHPAQVSSVVMQEDGTILVKHDIRRTQGYILTRLREDGPSKISELVDSLNANLGKGGYNANHVLHALKRLRSHPKKPIKLIGMRWSLNTDTNVTAFGAHPVNIRMPK